MKVLGIDQSYTSCGWCIIDENEDVVQFGTIKTSPNSDNNIFTRARTITNELKQIAVTNNISHIGLEGLAFGGFGNATRDLAGLQFLIVDAFGSDSVTITAPTSVKKLAVGKKKGKIEKKDLFDNLPEKIKNDFVESGLKKTKGLYDVTDSYWIAISTFRQLNKPQFSQ